jgi:hypothetical protein
MRTWILGLYFIGKCLILQAQQTFFTIPSGEITHKGKHFYQVQTNFWHLHSAQTKFDFDYGIGHHWELGFNLDTDLSWRRNAKFLAVEDTLGLESVTPLVLFNMQKGIPILPHPKLRINLGTQMGTNLINEGHWHWAYTFYTMLASEFMEDWHINLGAYIANDAFTGNGDNLGIFAGIEVPFSERWALMSDATFANTSNSIASLGISFNPTSRIQVCLGGITTTPSNPFRQTGVIFEISFFGWDFWDKNEE